MMNLKTCFVAIIFMIMWVAIVPCHAELLNSGFEDRDPNIHGTIYPRPLYWETVNHAYSTSSLNTRGTSKWLVNPVDLFSAFEGDYMALLDSESLDPAQVSSLRQPIHVEPGDRITGVYFFGTLDYVQYYDWAAISLIPADANETVEIVYIDVADVGDFGSTAGWIPFAYTIGQQQGGDYEFTIEVANFSDNKFASYFAVDNINICPNGSPSDYNLDCRVDLTDFKILAESWNCDCSDPNALPDPNVCPWQYDPEGQIEVIFKGDINGDKAVNHQDLDILLEDWL